jgi:pimeloyl-ACP methyl ester carboxylesterase
LASNDELASGAIRMTAIKHDLLNSFSGFIKINQDEEIFVQWLAGAGKPIVFLSGLSESHEGWHETLSFFGNDRPKLLIDLPGQGETLRSQLEQNVTNFYYTVEKQSEVLEQVLSFLDIPEIDLVGFSYGGGVALNCAVESKINRVKINNLILLVPYVLRLDLAHPLTRAFKNTFNMYRSLSGPFKSYYNSAEKIYDNFMDHYMDYRFSHHQPDPVYRRAAIELSQGMMSFDGFKAVQNLETTKLHLLSVGRDTLVPPGLYSDFWKKIPLSVRSSWTIVSDGNHLLFKQAPLFCANYIENILLENRNDNSETPIRHVTTTSNI